MAQTTPRGSSPRGSSRGGSSRRVNVAPVKKPFPWGFAAGAALLGLALLGIIVYAVVNTGSGFRTAADKLDGTFSGLQVTKNPDATHVAGRVDYPGSATAAPDGGNHNEIPQTCAVYTAPIVNEHAVHSLEHGAVWITYRPDLPADQLAVLEALSEGDTQRMLSPYPGQATAVGLQAWGRRLQVDSATDPRVERFVDDYTNGPQTREVGAACQGVDQPGTVPFVVGADGSSLVPSTDAPAPAADPSASASASPSASPTN